MNKIYKIILGENKKKQFIKICHSNDIQLDYLLNKNEFHILTDIFENREYSDYFPFYQNAIIIDIGAHYGYFSIFANKNTHPLSQIISIEPAISNYKQMTANLTANKIENVIAVHAALGISNGLSTLYTGKSSNHSLISNYKLINENKNEEKVECKTLETILIENKIEKVDFLKMDCEGSEYAILENLSNTCYDKISTISLEFHDLKEEKYTGNYLIELLKEHDFKITKYNYMPTTMGLNYGKIIATKI
ncbi:MAG: FkbM family methyltransferase [Bacteroidales bacterium]